MALDDRSSLRARDRVYAGHLFLAGAMALWRLIAATPSLSASRPGGFETGVLGRALALATLAGGVLALALVVVGSIARWRDPRTGVLLLLLALSLAWRGPLDVFDALYLCAVAILAALWFQHERARAAPRASGA